jgi:UPF0042 nucleotide-binding protein
VEQVVIITGMSGSGKSLAARCLEDAGYFCIDNLPVALIPVLIDLIGRSRAEMDRLALVVDVREGEMLRDFPKMIRELRARRVPLLVLYLEASQDVLIRRFSETRRPHPLEAGKGLESSIARERERLHEVREMADRVIDTSRHNAHELRAFLREEFDRAAPGASIGISVVSFGFKYGLPSDADIVLDVRFMPNPFFVEELRTKSGLDAEVVAYLEGTEEYRTFLQKSGELLEFLLPGFVKEGKSYLTIGVGCTGGKHRSVAVAQKLRDHLAGSGFPARITHRDIDKE